VISEHAPDPSSAIPQEQAVEASLESVFGEMDQLGQPAAILQVPSWVAWPFYRTSSGVHLWLELK